MSANVLEQVSEDRYPVLTIEQIQSACARTEPVVLGDPMRVRVKLPLRDVFYPLGFPLEITTNCDDIFTAAAASWHGFVKMFDTPLLRIRVIVTKNRSIECPPAPVCRIQQHLASNIADADNFATVDMAQGTANIWLTATAVENRNYLRYFFLESTAQCLIANVHTTPIHAACVELGGSGILLCGDSGAGKSSLSYACARSGWTYISDDASFLVNKRSDRLVVGNCHQARFRPSAATLFSELHGREITQRAPVGKPSIELNTTPLQNIAISSTSHVNHVVFLNRRNVAHQELVSFPAEVAKYFILQMLPSPPETLRIQTAMIDDLLCRGVLELRYWDMNWAIARLARLADEGR